MKKQFTRRDLLKVAGALSLSAGLPQIVRSLNHQQNIIVVVFDALSARNISLYGYQRETMPNLARLSEKAIVYHNHFSAGNFTTPGASSLLTGALPWSHRAFRSNGTVKESFTSKSIFSAFADYYRIAYSHNLWANTLLNQFKGDIDKLIPLDEFFLRSDAFLSKIFEKDLDIATVSWSRIIQKKDGYAYSLFLSDLYKLYLKIQDSKIANLEQQYPRGIPSTDYSNQFLLEQSIDGLANYVQNIRQPFLGYFHFWPPHEPYRTRLDFYNHFLNDGYVPTVKPNNPFSLGPDLKSPGRLPVLRQQYDEYILYADHEFGRFYDRLEKLGLLEKTLLVFTADHGESSERGIEGHMTPVLYQPLVRIPLLIFEPGRTKREDIFSSTSTIDVLPTLLHLTGHKPASWAEGAVLPPFNQINESPTRNLYIMDAKFNEQFAPLTMATTVLVRDNLKLIYYFGYDEWGDSKEHVELYNIENDPEELNDLSEAEKETSASLLSELKEKLAQVNAPYESTPK